MAAGETFDVELDEEQLLSQAEHLDRGGLFVPDTDQAPDVLADVRVRLRTPGGTAELDAQVVQVIPGAGIGLSVDPDDARKQLEPLFEKVRSGGDGEGNLYRRLARMTTPQKQELAQYGDRQARLALLKDTNKAVHPYLLRNRKLTLDELRIIASYRNVNPDVLAKIAQNREWMRDTRIVSALVCNPKTPVAVAKALVEKLPPGELRRLSKASDVPRPIAIAARNRLDRGR